MPDGLSLTAEPFSFDSLEQPSAPRTAASVAAHLRALEQEAREHGRREGLAEGAADAADRLAPAAAALAEAARLLASERERMLADGERRAVELALAIAAKVVGATIAAKPETVLEVVAGALRRTTERDRLVVEVSPQDLDLVRGAIDGLAGQLGGIGRLEVVAERRVERGGCVVRTPEGEIDASLDLQLERVAEVVRSALPAAVAADA